MVFHYLLNFPRSILETGTYWYPLRGLCYFVTHPKLWPFYATILLPQLVLTTIIYCLMFIFIFPLELPFYILMMGPLGIIVAWWTIIQQSGTISVFIITLTLMPLIQLVAYDAVLSRECSNDLVLLAKLRRKGKSPVHARIGRYILSLPDMKLFPFSLVKSFLIFSCNFVPVMGPVFVILLSSSKRGLQAHTRYFSMKGYNKTQIRQIHADYKAEYMGFGIAALILEGIPLLGIFFIFTNTLGATLWVVDVEASETKGNDGDIEIDVAESSAISN